MNANSSIDKKLAGIAKSLHNAVDDLIDSLADAVEDEVSRYEPVARVVVRPDGAIVLVAMDGRPFDPGKFYNYTLYIKE